MSATLRYRGDKNNLIELAKTLDAFKKVPEKYTETTEIGGTLSLLSRLLIVYLVYSELRYYFHDANIVYQFQPDIDMDEQVQMQVDITVAMPCASLSGGDLMDETQQNVFAYGTLQRDGTWWTMPHEKRAEFEMIQMTNQYLREQYHSVADLIFKDIIHSSSSSGSGSSDASDATSKNDKKKDKNSDADSAGNNDIIAFINGADVVKHQSKSSTSEQQQYDACRLHGTLGINKVAGVLHLVGGAQPVVGLFDDHWTIEFQRVPANFTHRINRLSFGRYSKRIVQPLEGDETLLTDEATTVQYFLKIVPTEIQNTFSTINTFQYAVTENVRKLDSERNSYGSPGIYFKYDWSALKIIVRNDRDNLPKFLIRLCSVIAGIIVVSGVLNALLIGIQRRLLCILAPELYYKLHHSIAATAATKTKSTIATSNAATTLLLPTSSSSLSNGASPGLNIANDLISTANLMASNVHLHEASATVFHCTTLNTDAAK